MNASKKQSRRKAAVLLVVVLAFFAACATRTVYVPVGDDPLVAEQLAELRQLRQQIVDMGELAGQVKLGIDGATKRLESGLERAGNIQDINRLIDEFVRSIIDENDRLGKLQQSDRGADAGTGHGFVSGVPSDG